MKPLERKASFEVLRVVAMFLVVLTHSFVWGMPFQAPKSTLEFNNILFPFFSALTSSSVNSFVIISGYFLSKSYSPKYAKAGKIWIQTFFYSVLFWIISREVGRNSDLSFLSVGLPIIHNQYWFVSQYLILLILSPFLARWCDSMDRKTYFYCLTVLFLLIGAITSKFPFGDYLFGRSKTPVFILLFMIAGYIARYELPMWLEKNIAIIFLTIIAIQWLGGLFLNQWNKESGLIYGAFSTASNGLPILSSTALLIWLRSQDWQDNKSAIIVSRIAPFVFGVYLIHDNVFLRPIIWEKLNVYSFWDSYLFYPYVLAVCILLFLVCITIDCGRYLIFSKAEKLFLKRNEH